MSEASEIFFELFYGYGAWLGCLLLMSIMLLVAWKIKWAVVLFMPLSIIMGASYLSNISASSDYMWCAVLMFLCGVLMGFRLVVRD